jgi:hypothetical protein
MRRIIRWLRDRSLGSLGVLVLAIGSGVLLVAPERGGRVVGVAAVAAGLCALVLELYDPETKKPRWVPVFLLGTLGSAGVAIGLWFADETGDLSSAVLAALIPLGCLYAVTWTQRVKHVGNTTLWWTWTVLGWITAPTVVAYVVAAVVFGPDQVMRAVL